MTDSELKAIEARANENQERTGREGDEFMDLSDDVFDLLNEVRRLRAACASTMLELMDRGWPDEDLQDDFEDLWAAVGSEITSMPRHDRYTRLRADDEA